MALTVAIMGITALVQPPKVRLPAFPTVCLALLVLIPLATLLPQKWITDDSPWRIALQTNWGIQLADTISPQPWVTAGAILFLLLGASFFATSLTQAYGTRARRMGIQALTLGISMICLASIAEAHQWVTIPWWPRDSNWGDGIGPFANRNHLATLSASGSVLAFACIYDSLRRHTPSALVFIAATLPIFTAIIGNTSRAGLLLSFIGLTLWMSFVAMRSGLFRKLAVGITILLLGASVLAVAGGTLFERLSLSQVSGDYSIRTRLTLYAESLRLFVEQPWTGIGLGNFQQVFNHLTTARVPRITFLHPESDFFQLLLEGGLAMTLALLALVGWYLLSTGPWKRQKIRGSEERLDRRLRLAAAITSGLMLIHAMVDVPLHGVRFFTVFAVISGFAIRPRKLGLEMRGFGQWTVRLAGLAVVGFAAGVMWPPGDGTPPLLGTLAAEHHYRAAARYNSNGQLAEGEQALQRALNIAPLDWRFHALRGQLNVANGKGASVAILDFGRARALEPNYAAMCFDEGVYWLNTHPELAIPAWREYLQRDPDSGPGIHGAYRRMINLSLSHPEIRDDLWSLADTAALKLQYLSLPLTPDRWNSCLKSLLANHRNLSGLSPQERRELFGLWYSHGDREQLVTALQNHPDWQTFGWKYLANHLASKSQFQEAYEIAIEHLPKSTVPAISEKKDLNNLERAFLFNPTDPRSGMELFWAQKSSGLYDEALITLSKMEGLPQAPSYLNQEFAGVYAAKGEFRKAWEYAKKAAEMN